MKKRLVALLVLVLVMMLALVSCGDPLGDWLNQIKPGPEPEPEKEVYVVYFSTDEGSHVPSQDVKEGDLVTRPEDPTKNGFEFAGWYKDAERTSPWNFDSDKVEHNTIIYAKWVAHKGGTPTCTSGPICESCGKEYGKPLGHTEEIIPGKAPTCKDAGLTDGKKCSVCGETLVAQEEIPATGEHTWGDWIVDKAATDTEDGAKHRDCSVCGDREDAIIPNLSHTHSYESEVTTAPGCETKGVKTFTCGCGDSYTEEIPATGHAWNAGEVTTAPGCETKGEKTFTCQNDASHTYTEEIPATGHAYDEGVVTKEATYGHKGTKTFTCQNDASHTKTEDIAQLTLADNATAEEIVNAAYTLEKGEALIGEFTLTGVITKVNYTYTASNGVTITIKVVGADESKTIYCYKLVGNDADKIVVGDTVTVTGPIKNYNGTVEFDQGCTLVDYTEHEHQWSEATCKVLATCSICKKTTGEFADHTYGADNKCTVCGHDKNSNESWVLVTDVAQLEDGAEIVIVSSKYNVAMSTIQRNNNRGSVNVAKDGNTVTINSDVQIIVLGITEDGKYTFFVSGCTNLDGEAVEDGYLYAASSSSNHLKTQKTNNANGTWTIEISDSGIATVKAQGSNTRNWLRYNDATNNGQLFSCYGSGQTDISIYVKTTKTAHTCTPADAVKENEVAPTCTAEGSYDEVVYCSECEKEISRRPVTVDALGHDMKTDAAVAPTCESTGLKEGSHCSRCDHKVAQEVVPALEHDWNDGVVTTAPTCEDKGVKTFTCQNDATHKKTEDVAATGHAWNAGEVTTAPRCETKGVKTFTCQNDASHTYTEEIPAAGHTDNDDNNVCDVCTKPVCGKDDHKYVGAETTAPTCTTVGTMTYTCSACGDSYTEDIAINANAHNYDEGVVTTPATCSSKGVKTFTCQHNSEHTYTEEVAIDATAHNYDEGVVTTPATCSAKGEKTFTCQHNNAHTYTEEVAIDEDAHSYDEGVVTTPATCSAKGVKTFTCQHNSEHTYTEEVAIDENAHQWNDGEVTKEATYGHAGVKTFTCQHDATHTKTEPIAKLVLAADATAEEIVNAAYSLLSGETLENNQTLTGVIVSIDSAYSTQYKNIEVTIKVNGADEIKTIKCYRMKGTGADKIGVGDTITVTGKIKNHYGTIEFDQGCTLDSYTIHEHAFAEATCQSPATCTLCGVTEGDVSEHNYVDGTCSVCGRDENDTSVAVTISKSHTDIAGIAGVTVGENVGKIGGKEIELDDNITIVCEKGKASTEPCIYTESIRLYQNGATLTVKGTGMTKIVLTLATKSGGQGPISVTGGTASELTNYVYTITVNAGVSEVVITTEGTDKNNRLYIASIEVAYTVGGSSAPEHECEHVCDKCGKCTDTECTEDVCAEKCICNRVVFSTTTTIDLSATGVKFEGNTGVYEGLEIDARNGKFADNNGGWVQVNAGTVITLYVLDDAQVSVTAYYSASNFTITVVDGVCTITATANDYLSAITVKYKVVYNEATTIDLSATGVHFEGNTGVYEGLEIDATNGKFADNGKSWVQVNAGTVITLYVFDGAKVSVRAYTSVNNFTITVVDGVCTITVVGNDYINTITIAEKCNCVDLNPVDHKCDVCGDTLSNCDDGDCNHFCDLCGERTTDCEDTDNDHCCEFCGDPCSVCEDTDNDHKCNTCGETLSECADVNKNHKCDICDEALSECADDDNDHECDLCFKSLSDCADNNNDHKCDICKATLSKCADADKNHFCDICGVQNSQCMDLPPYDHNCDWCGEKMSDHSYEPKVTAPTCVAEGYTTYTCACGDTYTSDKVPATGHTEETIPGKAATCTEDGLTDGKKCTVCKVTTVEQTKITAAGHKEVVDNAVAPTCTATGLTEGKHCSVCGTVTVAQTTVDALGHTADEHNICKVCGINLCGENHTVVTDDAVAATCTETGLTEGSHCSKCGEVLVAQDVVPATGHATEVEYWTYNNDLYLVPVCGCLTEKVLVDTTNGVGVYNEKDLVFLLTNGFDVVLEADIDLTETIDIEGSTATINLNGKTLKADWESDDVVEVLHIHDGSQITIIGEGNVISGGEYIAETNSVISCRVNSTLTIKGGNYYSASCGDVIFCETNSTVYIEGGHFEAAESYYGTWYVLDIDEKETDNRGKFVVTGGTFVNFDPANHTNDRDYTNKLAEGYHSIKGENNVYTVSKHSHTSETTAPTCTADGYTTYTCACGDTYTEAGEAATGHNYVAGEGKDATCTETGLTAGSKCSKCGDVEVEQEEIPSLGHDWNDATCEAPKTCGTCGATDGEALGHAWDNACDTTCNNGCGETRVITHSYTSVVTAPTCSRLGYTTYTCSVCDDKYTADETGMVNHKDDDKNYLCDYECGEIIEPCVAGVDTLTIEQAAYLGSLYAHDTYTSALYYVTGKIVSIKNTTYGNMTIEDENGNSIYIYGLNDEEGLKYETFTVKPVVGDTIKVLSIIGQYSGTPQLKAAILKEHTAHEHDYSEATCTLLSTCSICGETIGDYASHNYANGVCTVCGVEDGHEHADTDENLACDTCGFEMIPEADSTISIKLAIALALSREHNNFTTEKYYVTGTITEIYNTQYGNMYITDGNGNTLTIYGSYNADGTVGYSSMNYKHAVGQTVTVYGIVGQYNGTAQIKNGWVTIVHDHEYGEATCKVLATCTICGATTGELADHDYVDGACSVCGGVDPDYEGEVVVPTTVTVSKSHTDIASIAGVTAGQNTGVVANKEIKLDDNITVIFAKGGSTSDPCIYTESIRLYQNGATITIKGTGMTKIVLTLASKSGGQGPIAVTGGTASELSNYVYTITVNAGATEVVITTKGTSSSTRLYVANIEVTYTASGSSSGDEEGGETTCEHTNTTETTTATCTEAGTKTVTCNDCKATVSTEEIAALGHTTDNGTCTRCNETIGGDSPAEPTVVLEITNTDFSSTSYADNNNTKTENGYSYTTYQVYKNGTMQWQKGKGYITIASNEFVKLELKATAGTYTVTVGGATVTGTTSNGVTTYDLTGKTGEIKISVSSSAVGKTDYVKFYK